MKINWKIVSIILGILLLVGGLIEAYSYVHNTSYQQGINNATLTINQQILNSLEQNGYVPFMFMENNQTYNIKLIPEIPQNE